MYRFVTDIAKYVTMMFVHCLDARPALAWSFSKCSTLMMSIVL